MPYKPTSQGPQQPNKYPIPPGEKYQYWGEQPGFIYDPYRDAYMPDKTAANNYYQGAGLLPPGRPRQQGQDGKTYEQQADGSWIEIKAEKPGLIDQVAPLAVAATAVEGGKQIGANVIPGLFSSGGMFSSGAAPVAGAAAAPTASTAATGAGMLGSAGSGAATGASGVAGAADAAGVGGAQALAGTAGTFPAGFGLLPAAGIAAGAATGAMQAKGIYDVAKGKDMGFLSQAALALPTFGVSFGANKIRRMFDQDKWKTEGNRLKKLQKNGAEVPQGLLDNMPTKGRSFESMQNKAQAADFIGRDDKGNWVNNKFNMSRNVADLRGEDIVNYATFAENDPEWFKKPLDQRLQIANQALQQGAVKEHHGTVDVDWKKFQPQPIPGQPAPGQPQMLAPKDNMGSPGMRPKRNQGRPATPMKR